MPFLAGINEQANDQLLMIDQFSLHVRKYVREPVSIVSDIKENCLIGLGALPNARISSFPGGLGQSIYI